MFINGGGAGASAEPEPLYTLVDSAYTFRNSQSSVELANGARRPTGPSGDLITTLFGTATGAGASKRQYADGSMRYTMARALATSGLGVTNLNIPGNAAWADYPVNYRPARRYVIEWLAGRSLALTPDNIFEHGIQRNNSASPAILPSVAFAYGKFAFRSLDTENGGNWSVVARPVDGGAAVTTPTAFTPGQLRAFKMELIQSKAGIPAGLTMSIDGNPVGIFGPSYFPAPPQPFPVGSHDTIYVWSFGNEGAAGGSIFVDYDMIAEWSCKVYAL